ncbi:unnamed protein product [Mycena citricolor]|uniref:Uncharacterized protein n=1 Tax=Mycena citricolor TaxID=2018698 RepID=A0AAD2H0S4_9AGAR|nr:unnamed protein product [Mycena citricolor]
MYSCYRTNVAHHRVKIASILSYGQDLVTASLVRNLDVWTAGTGLKISLRSYLSLHRSVLPSALTGSSGRNLIPMDSIAAEKIRIRFLLWC